MGSLSSVVSAAAAKTTNDPAIKAAMVEAGIPSNRGAPVLTSVFYGDHKDIMLLSYFTALIKIFDGANGSGDPTVCLVAEHVLEWIGYALIVVIYVVRHFYEDPKDDKKPIHAKDVPSIITRCVVFMLFALCIHSQPLACALPRGPQPVNSTLSADQVPSPYLQTLSYVQGGVTLVLALVAAELLPTLLQKGDDKKGDDKKGDDKKGAAPATDVPPGTTV